jgi:DNA-binding winged helix-turn-helix (wHTH) protein/tetratricopeptide (TPR) repeat protein
MGDRRTPPNAPIRIDFVAERLWRGDRAVRLRPKSWAVLRVLAARPGILVTKDQLLDAVWPGIAVTEGTLNKSIGELRDALGDDRRTPRFIETVARRGFRWIGDSADAGTATAPDPVTAAALPAHAPAGSAERLVGRGAELAALHRHLARARNHTRQVVFVTADAGGGKTTLVDAFAAELDGPAASGPCAVAFGQCIESFGSHEPYLPLLEILEGLAQSACGPRVVDALRRHAPTWLAQIPSLQNRDAPAAMPEPMRAAPVMRELAAAFDAIAAVQPLVLVIEDAHWADLATTDVLNLLARRRQPASLMLLVTMRAADAIVADHPLLAVETELVHKRLASELPLTPFSEASVREYLAERCPRASLGDELVRWIAYQTGGNPFFVAAVVDDLLAQRRLVESADGWAVSGDLDELKRTIPDSLRTFLERQLTRLSPAELAVAETASVATGRITAPVIATALGERAERVEELWQHLALRRQIFRPSGAVAAAADAHGPAIEFVHGLVRHVLYDRLPPTRRRHLHLRMAEQIERECRGQIEDLAPQLAFHFERAGEVARAIHYLRTAADAAVRHGAPRDAAAIRERVLALVEMSPALEDRDGERITARLALAHARQLAFGFVDARVGALLDEARALAEAADAPALQFVAAAGLVTGLTFAARYREAAALNRRLVDLANRIGIPAMQQAAYFGAGSVRYRLGELAAACSDLEESLRCDSIPASAIGIDLKATALAVSSLVAAKRGLPDTARRLAREAIAAASVSGAYNESTIRILAVEVHAVLGDGSGARESLDRALGLATHHGFTGWLARARFLRGWLLAREGHVDDGIAAMRAALAEQRETGEVFDRSALCCLLADEILRADRPGVKDVVREGLRFAAQTGEAHSEPELHRLLGEAELREVPDAAAAEAHFRRAMALAGSRGARWYELRAATSLAGLLQSHGRGPEGRAALESLCASLREGEDLPDLRVARAMLI